MDADKSSHAWMKETFPYFVRSDANGRPTRFLADVLCWAWGSHLGDHLGASPYAVWTYWWTKGNTLWIGFKNAEDYTLFLLKYHDIKFSEFSNIK